MFSCTKGLRVYQNFHRREERDRLIVMVCFPPFSTPGMLHFVSCLDTKLVLLSNRHISSGLLDTYCHTTVTGYLGK